MAIIADYPFLTLPNFVAPKQRSRSYANEFFSWFVSQENSRVEVLRSYLIKKTGESLPEDEFSSLSTAWRFLSNNLVVRRKTPQEIEEQKVTLAKFSPQISSIIAADSVSEVPAAETVCLSFDVGFFIARVVKRAHSLARWMLMEDKTSIYHNEPVLALTGSGRFNLNPPTLVLDCVWRRIRGDHGDLVRPMIEKQLADIRSLKCDPRLV